MSPGARPARPHAPGAHDFALGGGPPAARCGCVSCLGLGRDRGLHSPLSAKAYNMQKRWDVTPESSSQRDAAPSGLAKSLSRAGPIAGWQVKIPLLRDPKL